MNESDLEKQLWGTVDISFLTTLNSKRCESYWEYLIQQYIHEKAKETLNDHLSSIRNIMILMRSLLTNPSLMQGEGSQENAFSQSARSFLSSYIKCIQSREQGQMLLKDLFIRYSEYSALWPSTYKETPTKFLHSLASLMMSSLRTIPSITDTSDSKLKEYVGIHKLYADICVVSPSAAFCMAEHTSLFPSKSLLYGCDLENSVFVSRFFSLQLTPSPMLMDNQIMLIPLEVDASRQDAVLDRANRMMSAVHKAQTDIVASFLHASPISRDYLLNLISTLCEANYNHRSYPVETGSSDGLLCNIALALLHVLDEWLQRTPCEATSRKLLLYVLSDSARVDFLRGNFPSNPAQRECLQNLMNWLRPRNHISCCAPESDWWEIVRTTPHGLVERIDAGLPAKPSSEFPAFVRSLSRLCCFGLASPAILRSKRQYDSGFGLSLAGRSLPPFVPILEDGGKCAVCGCALHVPYYRCVCCADRCVCGGCYGAEREKVRTAFSPPFGEDAMGVFGGREIQGHDPLTHLYTELRVVPVSVAGREMFRPLPPFAPHPPMNDDVNNTNNNTTNTNNDPHINTTINNNNNNTNTNNDPHINNTINNNNNTNNTNNPQITISIPPTHHIDKYYTLLEGADVVRSPLVCHCLEAPPCPLHGPITSRLRQQTHHLRTVSGFIHRQGCYYCKSRVIVGTVFRCLHCSLTLCEDCYQREMAAGGGVPSHQSTHLFVLEDHPLAPGLFLPHNRNDMRTVERATSLLSPAIYATGLALDQFDPRGGLVYSESMEVELLAVLTRLMTVGMAGQLQSHILYTQSSKLAFTCRMRNVQLAAGFGAPRLLLLAEHLSHTLLSLCTLFTPSNIPPTSAWRLHFAPTREPVEMNLPPLSGSRSRLSGLVVQDVEPSTLFGVLAPPLLDVVQYVFQWYVQQSNVTEVRSDLESGSLDYSLLLLLLCLNENVLPPLVARLDLLQTLFLLVTVSKEKNDVAFFFQYPVLRHFLLLFAQKLYIDSATFPNPVRAVTAQIHANKVLILLFRSPTCGSDGLKEAEQLLPALGLRHDLFATYLQDLIHQSSNVQDMLNELTSQLLKLQGAHIPQTLRMRGQSLLEDVKTAVNLFVRLIAGPYTREIIMSGYLMQRTTRFLLVVFSSLVGEIYRDHIDFVQTHIKMHYDKWLSVVLDEILQLFSFSPQVSQIQSEEQPSPAVALNPDAHFDNAVLISFVEDDGLFHMADFQWALRYVKEHSVLSSRKLTKFEQLVEELRAYQTHFDQLNKILEQCPDEFFDALMSTVMQDPVILPSGSRCDRAVIMRQMAVNPIDPFTRQPLTEDMLRPDEPLKQRIRSYLKEKLEELKKTQHPN